jgi:hypothetical protein
MAKNIDLKAIFINEQFEIGLYSERLRAEAESRPTANELAQAIRDAQSIRDDYRAKRGAYHSKQHTFTASTADDNSPQIASKLDIDRNRQSITPSHKRDDSELQGANRRIVESASEYRYFGNIKSEIEHRFVFSLASRPSSDHKPPVTGHQDRPNKSGEVYSSPSQQVIASQSKQINSQFQNLLTEKLNSQRAFHGLLGIAIFTVLMLLISFYFAFQARTNLKTIEAQKQMIQQNAQAITSQINYLNSLRR